MKYLRHHNMSLWIKRICAWLTSALLTFQPLSGYADVVVDVSGQPQKRADLDIAPNGVPVVNISEASQRGVSHNVFTQYDVGTEGIILNNSSDVVESQLGGFIAGNSNLNGRSARLIVNEVTGNNLSTLMGLTEVAGQAADYVLANPNGITCDGCGFINIPRATLATATPQFSNGDLTALTVNGGEFLLEGRGLDATNVTRLDILSRVARINAKIHADKLQMVTGAHLYDYQNRTVQPLEMDDSPALSLDVASLGGMYANRIALIGTEAGVGVRVDGSLASYGDDVVLTADGDIMMRDAWAPDIVDVSSTSGNVDILGNLTARQVNLYAKETLVTRGDSIVGHEALNVYADTIDNAADLIAGVTDDGALNDDASLVLRGNTAIDNHGLIYSAGSAVILGGDFYNQSNAAVQVGGELSINVDNLDNTDAQITTVDDMVLLVTDELNNAHGALVSESGSLTIVTHSFDNNTGLTSAGHELTITVSDSIDNSYGELSASNSLSLNGEGGLRNSNGVISVDEGGDTSLSLEGGLDNAGSYYENSENRLELTLTTLNNSGGQIVHTGTGDFVLDISGELNNENGLLDSAGYTQISAHFVNNEGGQISSATGLNFHDTNIINNTDGLLLTPGELGLGADTIQNNNGTLVGETGIKVETGLLDNTLGLLTGQNLRLNIDSLVNSHGKIVAVGNLDGQVNDTLNDTGWIEAGASFSWQGQNIDNTNGVVVGAGERFDLSLNDALVNNTGTLQSSANTTDIEAANIDNTGGSIVAAGSNNSEIVATNMLANVEGSVASNADRFLVVAAELDNGTGTISHGGNTLVLDVDTLKNQNGIIESVSRIQISGDEVNNNDGLMWGDNLSVEAAALSNVSGTLEARVFSLFLSNDLINTGGVINSTGTGTDALLVQVEGIFDNRGGLLQSVGEGAQVSVNDFDNQSGVILHQGNGVYTLTGNSVLKNTAGTISLDGELDLSYNTVENDDGTLLIIGGGESFLNVSGQLNNTAGTIQGNASTLWVNSGTLINNTGTLQLAGNGALQVLGARLENANGAISANTITLNHDTLDNTWGTILADSIDVVGADVINDGGFIEGQTLSLGLQGELDNRGGQLASMDSLTINVAGDLSNWQGVIDSGTTINLTANNLNNVGGAISNYGSGDSQLTIANLFDNTDGVLISNSTDLFVQSGLLINTINSNPVGGTIHHAGGGTFVLQTRNLNNTSGEIASLGDLVIHSNNADNTYEVQIINVGGNIFADHVSLQIDDLINTDGLLEGGSLLITATGNVVNGQVMNDDDELLSLGVNSQRGIRTVSETGVLSISAADLTNNYGNIQSNGILTDINVGSIQNIGGTLQHTGNGSAQLTVEDNIFNRAGVIDSDAALQAYANNFHNIEGGWVGSLDLLNLVLSGNLNNLGSTIDSANGFTLSANNLTNRGNIIATGNGSSTDTASLQLVNQLDNRNGLLAFGTGNITVEADLVNNSDTDTSQGLQHFGSGVFSVTAETFNNSQGYFVSDGAVHANVLTLDNFSGQLRAQQLELNTDSINNSQGMLQGDSGIYAATTNDLNNSEGLILTLLSDEVDALALFVGGTLNNENFGLIQSGGVSGTVQASTINNSTDSNLVDSFGSRISHFGDGLFTIIAEGNLQNQNAIIESNAALNMQVNSLDNSDGWISSQDAMLMQSENRLNNIGGLVVSQGGFDIVSSNGDILNNGGTIQGTGNATSRIESGGDFDNTNGFFYSEANDLTLLTEGDVNNTGGVISHAGSGNFNFDASNLFNHGDNDSGQGARFASNGMLVVGDIGRVENRGVDNSDSGVSVIAAQSLNLESGSEFINANGKLDLNGTAASVLTMDRVTNDFGHISTDGDLDINSGIFSNTLGTLSSLGNITLDLPNFNLDDGLLSAANNVTVNTTGDLINNAGNTIEAGSNLTINTDGDIRNFGILSTGGSLAFSGGQFQNGGGARLAAAGDLQFLLDDIFTNNGLIVSGNNLHIEAAELTNNDTLFAANDIRLYVSDGVVNNVGSEIFALNNLIVAANDSLAPTVSIQNTSGRITSFNGNMGLFTNSLLNERDFITIDPMQLISYSEEPYTSGGGNGVDGLPVYFDIYEEIHVYRDIVIGMAPEGVISAGYDLTIEASSLVNDASTIAASRNINMNGDSLSNNGFPVATSNEIRFRQEVYGPGNSENCDPCITYPYPNWESTVESIDIEESPEALIIAGGNIFGNFNNTIQNVVGSSEELLAVASDYLVDTDADTSTSNAVFNFNDGNIKAVETDAPPEQESEIVGDTTDVDMQSSNTENDEMVANGQTINGVPDTGGGTTSGTNELPEENFTGTTNGTENSETTVGPIAGEGGSYADASLTALDDDALSGSLEPRTPDSEGAPQNGDTAIPEVIITDPTQNLTLPDSSLLVIDQNNDADYLVHLGDAIRDYTDFVGSDYFLNRLGLNPADIIKRLGDGFYETRLVTDAIFETRGVRYLTNHNTQQKINSDTAQFEYLMDNAVTAAEELQLAVGVSLTPEQVARLTHDIVWMEEKVVNGETVLAPVYYATSASSDTFNQGAVIAANNVSLWADDEFINSGTIQGDSSVNLGTYRAFLNNGTVQASNRVDINANNIVNVKQNTMGGVVQSEDGVVSLTAHAGDISNFRDGVIDGLAVSLEANEGSIHNRAGTIRGRGMVVALARDDINNLADMDQTATITGGDVYLTAEEGDINNLAQEERQEFKNTRHVRIGEAANISASNLRLSAGQDINVLASNLTAENNLSAAAGRDINIEALANVSSSEVKGKREEHKRKTVTHNLASVSAGENISLHAGRDTNIVGGEVLSGGDIAIHSERDTNVTVVNDSEYSYDYKKKKKSFGRSETKVSEHYTETAVGGTIEAVGNVIVNARNTSEGLLTLDSGNVNLAGATVSAGENVVLAAGEDINITGTQTTESHFERKSKSGTFGLSGNEKGAKDLTVDLHAAVIAANDNVIMQSENNISMAGTDVIAGGDVSIEAVDEVLISAGEVLMQSDEWSKDSGFFSNDNVYSKTESREGDTLSLARASNVDAGGNLRIDSGSATIIGSNLHGEESVTIETDIGDAQFLAARTSVDTWSEEKEMSVSMGDMMTNLSRPDQWVETKDGRATMKLADATYDDVSERSTSTQVEGSRITTGKGGDITIAAAGNIFGEGVTLGAETEDGLIGADTIMLAGGDIDIVDAKETFQSQKKEVHGEAELSVVAQHQAVEVAKATKALNEAEKALKQAKKDYKHYQSGMDNMHKQLSAMEADLAAGVPGVSITDVVEMREILDDMEGDKEWYLTGIALAGVNLTSKTTQLAQQITAAAASVATYGFNAGVQLDIDATKSKTSVNEMTSVGSNIQAENMTMMTGMEQVQDENGDTLWQRNEDLVADTNITITGSNLEVNNTLTIDTGNLLIDAGKNTRETQNQTEHAHISAQMTVYGAAGGASINASYDRSKNTENETTWNNSQVSANVININTVGDTTIRGGNVHADSELNADIGGDLWVESRQNRYRSRNLSQGISAGMSFGGQASEDQNDNNNWQGAENVGDANGANGGINYGTGMSVSRETVRSSLTSGGTANINVGGATTIVAATIATIDEDGNDLGNLNLSTETLHYANLRDFSQDNQTSLAVSSSVSLGGGEQNPEVPTIAKDADGDDLRVNTTSVNYSNTSSYSASNSLATLGTGNINIRDEANSDSLDGINRDTTSTTYALWDVERQEGSIDLTLDHRLLSEEGRQEIGEDFRRSKHFGSNLADVLEKEISLTGGGDGETSLRQHLMDQNAVIDGLEQFAENKDALEDYINSDAPLEDRQAAYTTLLQTMSQTLGINPAEAAIILQEGGNLNTPFYENTNINQQIVGAYAAIPNTEQGEVSGVIFVDGERNSNSRDATETLGHEVSHHLDSERGVTVSTQQGHDNREAIAEGMGETFDYFMEYFSGREGYENYGSDYNGEVLASGGELISSNNNRFNRIDSELIEYRQAHSLELELVALTSEAYAELNTKAGKAMTQQEAEAELVEQLMRRIDSEYEDIETIETADKWLESMSAGSLKDENGEYTVRMFDANEEQYEDSSIFYENAALSGAMIQGAQPLVVDGSRVTQFMLNVEQTESMLERWLGIESEDDLSVTNASNLDMLQGIARAELGPIAFENNEYGNNEFVFGQDVGIFFSEFTPTELNSYGFSAGTLSYRDGRVDPEDIAYLNRFSPIVTGDVAASAEYLGLSPDQVAREGSWFAPGQRPVYDAAINYLTAGSSTPLLVLSDNTQHYADRQSVAQEAIGGYLDAEEQNFVNDLVWSMSPGEALDLSGALEVSAARAYTNNGNSLTGFKDYVNEVAAETSFWEDPSANFSTASVGYAENVGRNWEVLFTDDNAPGYMRSAAAEGVMWDAIDLAGLAFGTLAVRSTRSATLADNATNLGTRNADVIMPDGDFYLRVDNAGGALDDVARIEDNWDMSRYLDGAEDVVSSNNRPTEIIARNGVDYGEYKRLNQIDGDVGYRRPGEAGAAAELQHYFNSQLTRQASGQPGDFVFSSGTHEGKIVDFMLTPDSFEQAAKINQFFEKNMKGFSKTLDLHLNKADYIPMDTRFLTESNNKLLNNLIETLPKDQQAKIILFR